LRFVDPLSPEIRALADAGIEPADIHAHHPYVSALRKTERSMAASNFASSTRR
jgi:hypothetical protein